MQKRNRATIIKSTALILKIATVFITSPLQQFTLQEVIDATKEKLLELPEGFPTINEVLCNYDPVIQYAVEDIFAVDDDRADSFVLDTTTEEIVSKLLKKNHQQIITYSPQQQHDIKLAANKYVHKVKEWAIGHEYVLVNCFETLSSDLKATKRRVKKVENCIDEMSKVISETTSSSIAQKKAIELKRLDCFTREGDAFYNYLATDPTVTINNLFLCDNYEIIKLNVDCCELKKYRPGGFETKFQLSDFGNIIESQKVLLITGLYGTGKTMLMKKLHHECSQRDHNSVFFFRAKDINKVIDSAAIPQDDSDLEPVIQQILDEVFLQLKGSSNTVSVFIDEIEELNIVFRDKIRLNMFFAWLCKFIGQNDDFNFVLGSRKYALIGQDVELYIADQLFNQYFNADLGYEMNIVCANVFTSDSVDKWIDQFSALKNSYVHHSIVKDSYKKINNALRTPIFLFAFMQRYLEDSGGHNMNGYYFHYSKFIENTIKGKYCVPFSPITLRKLPSDREYRQILRKVAFYILRSSNEHIASELHESSVSEEQPLLAEELTNVKYGIKLEDLKKLLGTEEYDTANVVNCYFFCADDNRVYFTDTNVLFALASEFIFCSIEKVVQDNDCIFHVNHFKRIEMIHLYPHLVDYVVYLTKNSSTSEKISDYVHSFATNDTIKCCILDLNSGTSYDIEKILLLYILFLKTNKEPYNQKQLKHVFKELSHYVNIYKTTCYQLDVSQYAYSIERYFMGLDLHHLTLKRINLKHYNFKGSRITDVCKFQQCNFYKTNFLEVIMDDVKFSLCHFKKVDEFSISKQCGYSNKDQAIFDCCNISDCSFVAEAVIFRNCKIDNLTLILDGNRSARFEKCFISKLRITVSGKKQPKELEFMKCCFENEPSIPEYIKVKRTGCF